jgi:uncharacterized caspase-like protein
MLVRFDANGAKSFERRVALVVGNGAYGSITQLANPANDAASMARALQALGFIVHRSVDVTTQQLNDCRARFESDLANADVALFFYAGHGVQITTAEAGGAVARNYMLSTDAKVDATGTASGFFQIDAVLTAMRAKAKQAVFFLDACRNNPFSGRTDSADAASLECDTQDA